MLTLGYGIVCLAACAATAATGDWPQWGGQDCRNMVADAHGLPATFVPGEKRADGSGIDMATTKNVRWIAKLGSQTYGNTTVANGRVFVGTNDDYVDDPRYTATRGGLLKCFAEATGKLLWQLEIPRLEIKKENFNFDNIDLGICSSPTVDGDRVYLVSNRCEVLSVDVHGMANGNDGPFRDEAQYTAGVGKKPVAIKPTDGDIVWRYDMIRELPVWPQDAACCSILVHGDLLYVCTANGVDKSHDHVPYPLAPSLIVLEKHTGRLVAQDDEKIGTRLFHGQWSNPSLGRVNGKDLVFYGGGDGICYAFEALDKVPQKLTMLKKVWSFDCNPPHYHVQNGKPVHYRDGDIRRHKPIDKGDGSFFGPSEIIATPVFYKNRVYIATGQDPSHGRGHGMLACIDATKTGEITQSGKVWMFDKIDRSLSTVSIADGLLYVAETFGKLYCLDPETGKTYWVHDTKSEIWGSTLVADGKVYLGTKKGLWVFQAGRTKKVLGEIRLGSPVYCTPIVANGTLFVATHKYLWAVRAPEARVASGE
jgi:outer membrane protein assembly factor BamB